MSTKRLALLQLLLVVGLGSVYLVPTQAKTQPMGVIMDLPESMGQWSGEAQKVTQQELDQLAADTSFARRVYSNPFGDQVVVSIVLAGEDPDNSIHRPERCLPAQGWTILDSRTVAIKAPTLPNGELRVTRLHNVKTLQSDNGESRPLYNLNYYWFVGYSHVTPSHIDRALTDIRDRVMKGYNQRWAYVTVASSVSEGFTRFGRTEAETDKMIQSLIQEIYPRIVRPSVLKGQAADKAVAATAQ